jgi:hypothetical protein
VSCNSHSSTISFVNLSVVTGRRVDNATLTIRASPDSSKDSLASRIDWLRSLTQTGGISVLGVSRTVSRTDASNKQFLDIISWLAAEKYCLLLEAVKDTLTQDISHASIPVFLDQLVQQQKGSLPLKVVICKSRMVPQVHKCQADPREQVLWAAPI